MSAVALAKEEGFASWHSVPLHTASDVLFFCFFCSLNIDFPEKTVKLAER